MTLAEFTNPALIIPELEGKDVAAVIAELSQAMQREGRVTDWQPLYQAALNRESLISTETQAGMSFPHARLAGLKEVSFALGRKRDPFLWGTGSPIFGASVRLVFLIAAPEDDSMRYLQLISGLVSLAKAPALVEELYAAQNAIQMLAVLEQVQVRTDSENAATTRR